MHWYGQALKSLKMNSMELCEIEKIIKQQHRSKYDDEFF